MGLNSTCSEVAYDSSYRLNAVQYSVHLYCVHITALHQTKMQNCCRAIKWLLLQIGLRVIPQRCRESGHMMAVWLKCRQAAAAWWLQCFWSSSRQRLTCWSTHQICSCHLNTWAEMQARSSGFCSFEKIPQTFNIFHHLITPGQKGAWEELSVQRYRSLMQSKYIQRFVVPKWRKSKKARAG